MSARPFRQPLRNPASGLPDPATRPEFYARIRTKRLVAWIIDMVLIAALSALLVPFTAFTALFFFPFFMLVTGFVYRWFSLATASATGGMVLMGVQLRDSEGYRLRSSTALWHTLGYSVSVAMTPLQLLSVGLMCITDRRQGLTDLVLGTTAINRPLR